MWIRAWRVASWERSYRQGRQDECVSLSQLLRGFAEVHSRRPSSGCTAVYWRWAGRGDDARMPTQPWRAWAWRRGVVEKKKEAWALEAVMAGSGFGAWLGGLGPRTTHMQRRWVPAWTGRLLLTAASCIQLRARPDVSMQARPASTQLGTDSPTCRSRSTCRTWRPLGEPVASSVAFPGRAGSGDQLLASEASPNDTGRAPHQHKSSDGTMEKRVDS